MHGLAVVLVAIGAVNQRAPGKPAVLSDSHMFTKALGYVCDRKGAANVAGMRTDGLARLMVLMTVVPSGASPKMQLGTFPAH
jgi:hypothetical protein